MDSEAYIEELEDLLYKLRLCPNTTDTLPSTHHSVIRSYIAFGKHNELLRVLDDRLNFGIFPDDYCTALLMDTFLKEKNYTGKELNNIHILQVSKEQMETGNICLK
jgi:Mitochondrial 28S ribosomal protein S27.